MRVLTLNAGGASVRAALFALDDGAAPPGLAAREPIWSRDLETVPDDLDAAVFAAYPGAPPDLVAHRVVHGGLEDPFGGDVRVDAEVERRIEAAAVFAPSHNRTALRGMAAARRRFPAAASVAVFDHALRADSPLTARLTGGPWAWYAERGVQRIGFHGISHHDCAERVAAALGRDDARVVAVHLGSGCSAAAFRGRAIVETTMGTTPLDGLLMGTRAGATDPGLLLHLLREGTEDVASLTRALSAESGLLGLSGVSLDTREVLREAEAGNARARTALDLYVHRIRLAVGAMAAALGGLDALSWSGPVGEHMAVLRAEASAGLGFLGVAIDPAANAAAVDAGLRELTRPGAAARSFVIPTLEEWAMLRRAVAVVA